MKAKHMLPVSRRTDKSSTTALPLLCNGDRLTQPEFHRRYLTYPDDAHFELIGGIVQRSPWFCRRFLAAPANQNPRSGPKAPR